MQHLTQTVQAEWEKILRESAIYQKAGNSVTVTFILNSKGRIPLISKVESTTGTSNAAKQACVAAITLPLPYDRWTADMIAALGKEQQLSFTFYYQ